MCLFVQQPLQTPLRAEKFVVTHRAQLKADLTGTSGSPTLPVDLLVDTRRRVMFFEGHACRCLILLQCVRTVHPTAATMFNFSGVYTVPIGYALLLYHC